MSTSALELLGQYSVENAHTTVNDFKFSLEDYFKPEAELLAYSEALEMMAHQYSVMESVSAQIEAGSTEISDVAASIINNFASMTIFAVTGADPLVVTLSMEEAAAAGEDKKEGDKGVNKSGMMQKLKVAKDNAVRIAKKFYNFLVDYLRKFRTGTSKLQAKITEAMKAPKAYSAEKAPEFMLHDGGLAAAGDIVTTAKVLVSAQKSLGDVEKLKAKFTSADANDKTETTLEVKGLGNVTYKVTATATAYKLDKVKGKEFTGKVDLSVEQSKQLLKACQDAARLYGATDPRIVSQAQDKLLKEFEGKSDAIKMINALASGSRTMMVSLPAAELSAINKIVNALAKGKAEQKKEGEDK